MTFAVYADRSPTGTGRGNVTPRPMPPIWLVLHTSEGAEGHTSAEALCRFITSPASGGNVASYHYVFDTDQVCPVVRDGFRAHHAAGGNDHGLGACFPGTARQTAAQWHDPVSAAYLEQCARWLADKHLEYGIPLTLIGPAELRDGRPGVCGHVDVSEAFGLSTHWDPGQAFPYGEVIARATELVTTLEEDSMTPEQVKTIVDAAAAKVIARIDRSIEVTREGRQEQRNQFQRIWDHLTGKTP